MGTCTSASRPVKDPPTMVNDHDDGGAGDGPLPLYWSGGLRDASRYSGTPLLTGTNGLRNSFWYPESPALAPREATGEVMVEEPAAPQSPAPFTAALRCQTGDANKDHCAGRNDTTHDGDETESVVVSPQLLHPIALLSPARHDSVCDWLVHIDSERMEPSSSWDDRLVR